jgi:hypothetical protein
MVEINKEKFKELKQKLRENKITEDDFNLILNNINKIHQLQNVVELIERKIIKVKEETDNTVNKLNEKLKNLLEAE